MIDYIILISLLILIVLAAFILITVRKPAEEEDDGRAEEMVENLLFKLEDNKEAVQKVSVQCDMMSKAQVSQIQGMQNTVATSLKFNREEQNKSFASFREEMMAASERQNRAIVQLQKTTNDSLIEMQKSQGESLLKMQEQMNNTLRTSIESITKSNEKKLDEIRGVVTEKLDKTLNERLDSNFKQVGEQMANLYKSLGELQQLSSGVTNLNKTLSNVKTRGNWGEVQLGRILEQTLARDQYEENIATKSESSDRVEYAIKLPSEDGTAYLPIDAKFPVDIYNRIVEASENADEAAVKTARNELTNRIKMEAATISDKYLDPPNTADYAIMYLPTEGLYAEVLRIDGLTDYCHSKRIMIAGPTTIMALLNTISIGFRHMALNKKSEEIRKILEATKTQIDKLEETASKVEDRIDKASKAAQEIKDRTRIMKKKMGTIATIDTEESDRILGIDAGFDDDED
ncbi:MAG: DNA recombination protein RmuC [Clostridiales bacterium]|nr:DNA recombination protein RmuC [Clostridiales bacterium]